jgi:cytochrome P450 / NADPH-cytochrome P450 reductase
MRGCIGRAFAWQEALLVVALVLQNFELRLDNPSYEIKVDQSLTIKPRDLDIRASLRPGITTAGLQERLSSNSSSEVKPASEEISSQHITSSSASKPIQILYGTTTGTTQSFAQKLATQLSSRGWNLSVHDLDLGANKISKGIPLVLITSSYEGQPPDNGHLFVAWLENMTDKHALEGVQYAVFGCGHSDWRQTFQRIPILVDDGLAALGATRLVERGFSDAAMGDILTPFEDWIEKKLLPALPLSEGVSGSSLDPPTLSVEPKVDLELSSRDRASHLQHNVQWGSVVDVRCLTPPGQPEKRHIEIQLTENMSYHVGDYLVVLPLNPDDQVKRVVKRFSLPWDSVISISGEGSTILPTSTPLPLVELLKGYVELSEPATRKVRTNSANATMCL